MPSSPPSIPVTYIPILTPHPSRTCPVLPPPLQSIPITYTSGLILFHLYLSHILARSHTPYHSHQYLSRINVEHCPPTNPCTSPTFQDSHPIHSFIIYILPSPTIYTVVMPYSPHLIHHTVIISHLFPSHPWLSLTCPASHSGLSFTCSTPPPTLLTILITYLTVLVRIKG